MAEQVIIEFVADTNKLEEAYNKLNGQIADSSNLNRGKVCKKFAGISGFGFFVASGLMVALRVWCY